MESNKCSLSVACLLKVCHNKPKIYSFTDTAQQWTFSSSSCHQASFSSFCVKSYYDTSEQSANPQHASAQKPKPATSAAKSGIDRARPLPCILRSDAQETAAWLNAQSEARSASLLLLRAAVHTDHLPILHVCAAHTDDTEMWGIWTP